MVIIYNCTIFQISAVITTDLKPKWKFFFVAAILLYYVVHKITTKEAGYFLKICYHTEYQNPTMSGAILAPTSQVCASSMLVLLM